MNVDVQNTASRLIRARTKHYSEACTECVEEAQRSDCAVCILKHAATKTMRLLSGHILSRNTSNFT